MAVKRESRTKYIKHAMENKVLLLLEITSFWLIEAKSYIKKPASLTLRRVQAIKISITSILSMLNIRLSKRLWTFWLSTTPSKPCFYECEFQAQNKTKYISTSNKQTKKNQLFATTENTNSHAQMIKGNLLHDNAKNMATQSLL